MMRSHEWRWTLADSARQAYRRLTGVPVECDLRGYLGTLARIDAIDAGRLSDAGLVARFEQARRQALAGEPLDALLPETYAVVAEACGRTIAMRPFDVQVMAGAALHQGKVVQLATGEGKTLVAVLPVILNALTGQGAHVFTANDYLARRDAEWMGPVYRFFGLRADFIAQAKSTDERRRAYLADVTYATAKEAGFDYLRDRTAASPDLLVQRAYHCVIVDEADFILVDEARVPLVIAGAATRPDVDQRAMAALVRDLMPGADFRTDEYARTVTLTEHGFAHAERLLHGVALHEPGNTLLLSAVHVALHAETLLRRDRDYIVRAGRVELVDEFTGRVADNRRWPHGIRRLSRPGGVGSGRGPDHGLDPIGTSSGSTESRARPRPRAIRRGSDRRGLMLVFPATRRAGASTQTLLHRAARPRRSPADRARARH
jgi:preprotein translocase subunit SecA